MEGRRKIAYSWRQVEELLHLVTSGGREGGGGCELFKRNSGKWGQRYQEEKAGKQNRGRREAEELILRKGEEGRGGREGGKYGRKREREEGGGEGRKEGKETSYEDLVHRARQAGYNTHLITVEVGARGVPHMAAISKLNQARATTHPNCTFF